MKINIYEMAVFGMLGGIMYASKLLMEFLPNVHLLGVFVIAITAVYRQKALYSIYIYVLINGLFAGFSMWWIPYLYIWTVLWGAVMLLPKNMSKRVQTIVYILLCSLHGFLFGTLYSAGQAIMFGLSFEATIAWIIAGLPWDAIHGIGNLFTGLLIMPIISVIRLAEKNTKH